MEPLFPQAKHLRQELAHDRHRPQFHFLPPGNWMNDPNGLIRWRDQYHLFYQHNPNAPVWGNIHWGHAVSDDLIHWSDLPIALSPSEDGPDKDGCWSGCAVDNNGVPTLLYTGVFPEVQCIATSTDGLLTWKKHPANPIIASPPEHIDVVGFRDPYVWQRNGFWYMALGTGIKDVGGAVLLYKSADLCRWDYMNPILIGDKRSTGEMWECPCLVPFGNKYALIVSIFPHVGTHYFIGTYEDKYFTPELQGTLDLGPYFFAPQTLRDHEGRCVMFGWVSEGRSDNAQHIAGWAGILSVPKLLTLGSDGYLGVDPLPELQVLRGRFHSATDTILTQTPNNVLTGVQGDCLEIVAEFELGDAEEIGIKVRCSPRGEEQTLVAYNRKAHCLKIDRSLSSLSADVDRDVQSGTFILADRDTLKLHVFLDRSVIEVFANGLVCLTSRIYPSRGDSLGLDVFSHGGRARLKAINVWEMQSIWK